MKNFLIAFVAGSILALAAINRADAQGSNDIASIEQSKKVIKIDRSVFPAETNTAGADASVISAKALKNFKKSYKNASDEKWFKNENGVTAHFASDGISNVVYYDKKGRWEASLKNYNEDKFNGELRSIVKQKYFDYKITLVQEIETASTNDSPTYIVHLEGDNDFKLIRVSDGAMDVYMEFEKQK